MSFGAELKDFINAAGATKKLLDNTPEEERKARTDYYRANTEARKQGTEFQADAYKRAQMPNTDLINEGSQTGANVRGDSAIPDAPAPKTSDASQPRGIRNNNPGNIEDGPFARSLPGYTGSDGRFAKFESPSHGMQAMDNLLSSYNRKGINTVSALVNRWAPQSDGNNTSNYAGFIAQKLGVDPNAPINLGDPAVRQKIAPLIGQFENGRAVGKQSSALPVDGDQPMQFAAEGGPVGEATEQQALPTEDDDDTENDNLNGDTATEFSSAGRKDNNPLPLIAAGHKAVKDGLTYAASKFGLGSASAMPDPRRLPGARAYLSGQGAAPNSDMQQVFKAVDPEGKMSESERNIAALGAVYNYYSVRDPAKAQGAAASMLQYMRTASARYNSIAAAHAHAGDIDGTVKNMLRAYANIPNGQDVQFQKNQDGTYAYSFTDQESGKVVNKGVASPEQIAGLAMKMTPGEFDKWIMTAAGQRAQAESGPSPAYQQGMKALDDSAPAPGGYNVPGAAPAPAAPAQAAAPQQSATDTADDEADDEADGDQAAIPPNAEFTASNPQGNTPAAPVFDSATYSQMGEKEQKSYIGGFNAKVKQYQMNQKAQPKPEKGPKALTVRDGMNVNTQIKSAWDEHVDDLTPEDGKAPAVAKPLATKVKTSAAHIFSDNQNRTQNITPREAIDVSARLSLATVTDPATAGEIQSKPVEGGKLVRLSASSRPVFVPDAEFEQLKEQAAAKLKTIKEAKDKASKPGIGAGIVKAIGDGWASGTTSTPSATAAPAPGADIGRGGAAKSSAGGALPVFRGFNSVPLSEAPPGSVPNQGLGER